MAILGNFQIVSSFFVAFLITDLLAVEESLDPKLNILVEPA